MRGQAAGGRKQVTRAVYFREPENTLGKFIVCGWQKWFSGGFAQPSKAEHSRPAKQHLCDLHF